MTGVLLIALGDKHYVQLALNLAVSIKVNTPDMPICLIHDGGHDALIQKHAQYFDHTHFLVNSSPFSVKTLIYDLTPFDNTLYLDVDTILLPDCRFSEFIAGLKDVDFAMLNTLHNSDINIWADPAAIRKFTNNFTDPFYHYYSELIYFKKCEKIGNYFDAVRAAYSRITLESRLIAGQIPDELAFLITSMQTGVYPHQANWHPLFWHFRDKKDTGLQFFQLNKKYIGYSIGGNALPQYVKSSYDNIVSFYERKTGLKGLCRSTDKRLLFRNRIKI